MYLISGNITSNVTGNLLVITGNGNIGNITSNFRTLRTAENGYYDCGGGDDDIVSLLCHVQMFC